MPRVPEAEFRLEPSSRVGNEQFESFDTPMGKQLEKAGPEFAKIGLKLAATQKKADSLNKANNVNKRYEKEIASEVEKLTLSSKRGVVVGADGKEEKLSTKVSNLFTKFDKEVQFTLENDPDAMKSYGTYTRAKMQSVLSRARKLEKTQVVDGTISDFKEKYNLIHEKALTNEDVALDMAQFNRELEEASSIIGASSAQKLQDAMRHGLGLNAANYIRRNGFGPAQIKKANEYIQGLPAGQKLGMEHEIKKAVMQGQKASVTGRKSKAKDLADKVGQSPQMAYQTQYEANQFVSPLISVPLQNFETMDDRIDSISEVMGAQMGNMLLNTAFIGGPDVKDKSNVPSTLLQDRLGFANSLRVDTKNYIDGLKKSGKLNVEIDADELQRKIFLKGMTEFDGHQRKKRTDNYTWNTEMNGAVEVLFEQGDEDSIEQAMSMIDDANKRNDIPLEDYRYIGLETSEKMGKEAQGLLDGGDPSGTGLFSMVQGITSKRGKYGLETIRHAIMQGGSTKYGTNVPSEFIPVAMMEDENLAKEMLGDMSTMKKTFASVDPSRKQQGSRKLKISDVDALVNEKMQDSSMGALYIGRNNQNLPRYNGMKGLIKAHAIKLWKNGEELDSAIEIAQEKLYSQFTIGKQGDSSLTVDNKFGKAHKITEEDMESLVADATKAKHLPNPISIKGIIRMAPKHRFIDKNMEALKDLHKISPSAAQAELAKLFDIVIHDGEKPNTMNVLLRSNTNELIPAPLELANDKIGSRDIPISEYFKSRESGNKAEKEIKKLQMKVQREQQRAIEAAKQAENKKKTPEETQADVEAAFKKERIKASAASVARGEGPLPSELTLEEIGEGIVATGSALRTAVAAPVALAVSGISSGLEAIAGTVADTEFVQAAMRADSLSAKDIEKARQEIRAEHEITQIPEAKFKAEVRRIDDREFSLREDAMTTEERETLSPLRPRQSQTRLLTADDMQLGREATKAFAGRDRLMKKEGTKKNALGQHIAYKLEYTRADGTVVKEKFLTAGIGHKLTKQEAEIYKEGDVIPDEVVARWFRQDTNKAINAVKRLMPFDMPDKVRGVFIRMAFQMGEGSLSEFRKSTIPAIKNRQYQKAAEFMAQSKWAGDTPARAQEEIDIIRSMSGR